jgi:hypothetical protein
MDPSFWLMSPWLWVGLGSVFWIVFQIGFLKRDVSRLRDRLAEMEKSRPVAGESRESQDKWAA